MNAFSTPQEPLLPEQAAIMAELQSGGFTTYNTGVSGMPKSWLTEELQATAARIEQRGKADDDLSAQATADALFNMASGFEDAACECVQSAASLRRFRA